ncbi:MAG: AraC family transcriptional regulator [Desulfobacteraceae bacterium]
MISTILKIYFRYQCSLKHLYFESKTLELIAHSALLFIIPNTNYKGKGALRPYEIERVQRARELVGRYFQNPPKLVDLARIVGLPHPKLNFCFREVYGTTIFDYLREMRLDKAKSLLEEGHMNVTEVAYEVGYSSLSHFAKAYKNYHGIAPGNYLREIFHKWS